MDKIEYIANQLKKTHGKKYENYCIARIINKLDKYDLKFITQQGFKRTNGDLAYADLYLPQVNVWVEVNEFQHFNQEKEDKLRIKEIRKNDIKKKLNPLEEIKYDVLETPEIIEIFNKDGTIRKDINEQIDIIVYKIEKRIIELEDNFKPWKKIYEEAKDYIDKGYIDVKDNVQLKTIYEVSKLFNKKYKKGSRKNYFSVNNEKNIYCWCPKVKIEDKEFKNINYYNIILDDGKTILEIDKKNNNEFLEEALNKDEIRYTFCYHKNECSQYMYKFKGIYILDKEKSIKLKKRTWKKIGDNVDLTIYFN